jgi:hypothetical protein
LPADAQNEFSQKLGAGRNPDTVPPTQTPNFVWSSAFSRTHAAGQASRQSLKLKKPLFQEEGLLPRIITNQ